MAEFVQPPDQQDPDALKKAILAKLLGGPIPGAVPPPGATQRSLTGTPDPGTPPALGAPPTTQPNVFGGPVNSSATATPISTAPANAGPQPARPINGARSATTAPAGMAGPASGNSAAIEPGNQPPPNVAPFPNETDWSKQNPLPAHTPYQAPDFKHRLLMGIFGGMQEFGRPGEGAKTVRDYLGDIERRSDEEKNYPTTSAAMQHQKYMAAGQGAEVPEHLREMKAQIDKTEAEAKAKLNPPQKLQHFIIDDLQNPGQPKAVNFDQTTGAYLDPETHLAIPGAKPWEKPEHTQPPKIEYDSGIPVAVTAGGKTYDIHDPNLPAELKPIVQSATGAHKQYLDEQTAREARAAARSQGKAEQNRSDKSADVIERETRTNIRKAQQTYRGAEATSNMQREFIKEAKGGNKAAVKIVPLEGALEITTSQGVHRINRTEVEQYGGAGTVFDKIHGALEGKLWNGKDIPDNVLDDMDRMTQEVEKNAYERYSSEYDDEVGIAKNNGIANIEQHLPRIKQRSGGGGNASADASGAAGGGGGQPLPSFKDWKAKQGQPGALPPGWK